MKDTPPPQTEQTALRLAETIRVAYLRGSRDPDKENMTETIHELRDVLLSILTASNREAVIKALTPYTDLQDETEATKFEPCNFCGQVSYQHTCDSALIGVEKMANRDIAELTKLKEQ